MKEKVKESTRYLAYPYSDARNFFLSDDDLAEYNRRCNSVSDGAQKKCSTSPYPTF